MATKTMTVQELQEYDPRQFNEKYQRWSEDRLFYQWWDGTYDRMKKLGAEKGFRIDDIEFSGFYSQGDGAWWGGRIDVMEFIEKAGLTDDPKMYILSQLIKNDFTERFITVRLGGRRWYSSRVDDVDYVDPGYEELHTGPLAGASAEELFESIGGADAALDDLGKTIHDAVEDFDGEIFDALRDEYEYLTSEEAFIDCCNANEVTFEVEVDDEETV